MITLRTTQLWAAQQQTHRTNLRSGNMLNSWANYDATGKGVDYGSFGFERRFDGTVRLSGLLQSGTNPSAVLDLEQQVRPYGRHVFIAGSANTARVDVLYDGEVYVSSYSSYVSLCNVEFSSNVDMIVIPTLVNSWVDFGSDYERAGYWKDAMGFVHLHGLVKSGSNGSTLFTLPAGFRPAKAMRFATLGNGIHTVVRVNSDGTVKEDYAGGGTYLSLSGICFLSETSPLNTDWAPLTLLNGWVGDTISGVYHEPEYLIAPDGYVYLRGNVDSGTTASGTNIAELPSAALPPVREIYSIHSNGRGMVDVSYDGYLKTRTVDSSALFLDGVRYRYSPMLYS